MLEGGFFTAALALVGIVPAHPLQIDRSRDLALIPVDPVARSTTAASPQPGVGSMPAAPVVTGNDRYFPVDPRRPKPVADTQEFVDWLAEIQEFGELTQRRLLALYAEFCEDRFVPVSPRRLLLQIGACGVQKRRTSPKTVGGKSQRIRVYWIPRQMMRRAAA